ncbi:hypothetical protein [uncultured Imperialibacter sp.]|uniref:hypothetical protein n=1 Tax=uncultured Imperialibacter sp. TaxID=1672639 RepID=UPI0030D7ABAD
MPQLIQAKTILSKPKRRDPWFLDDYTINPYSGCSFNSLFCYIRGSKYGIHMEEKLAVKQNAATLLDKALFLLARKVSTATLCCRRPQTLTYRLKKTPGSPGQTLLSEILICQRE